MRKESVVQPSDKNNTDVNTRTEATQNTDNKKPTPTPTNTTDLEKSVRRTCVVHKRIRTVIDFRVSSEIKEKYMQLSANKKKIVKLVLENTILALSGDRQLLEEKAKELGIELARANVQPVLNINVSVSEAKNTVNINVSELIRKLDEIQRYLVTLYKVSPNNSVSIPKAKFSEIVNQLDEIRRRLEVN